MTTTPHPPKATGLPPRGLVSGMTSVHKSAPTLPCFLAPCPLPPLLAPAIPRYLLPGE